MSRTLVSHCPTCGHKARIESSKVISKELKQLYFSCGDPACGQTWVSNLEYSHTLSPSAYQLPENMREQLKTTSLSQQQNLFECITSPVQ